MPKYKKNSVTGDVGEYYFSYWITRYFEFPCRLQPIDLGIDAIIELAANEEVKGELISVQIKTTNLDNCTDTERTRAKELKKSFNVSHLQYWSESQLPMIFAFIIYSSDKEPEIYVKNIKDEYIVNLMNKLRPTQKNQVIKFQESDRLDIKYREKLLEIYLPNKETFKHFSELKEMTEDFLSTEINCNDFAICQIGSIFAQCDIIVHELDSKATLRNNDLYWDIENILDEIRDKVRDYLSSSDEVKYFFIEDCDKQSSLHDEITKLIQPYRANPS